MSNRKSNRGTVSSLRQTMEIFLLNKHLSSARYLSESPGKIQYFGHLMWTVDSLGKSLMLAKIEGRTRRGYQRMRWLNGITDAMDMNLGKLREILRNREAWLVVVHVVAKSQTLLGDWTTSIPFLGAELLQWINPNPCFQWLTSFFLNLIKKIFLTVPCGWWDSSSLMMKYKYGVLTTGPPGNYEWLTF